MIIMMRIKGIRNKRILKIITIAVTIITKAINVTIQALTPLTTNIFE
ncbi:hypothetical protein HOA91_03050 [Candidatus Woesearchaeota archaeon]|nr:hypothetical protein [Candidatus Woesearchaeota archaeon]